MRSTDQIDPRTCRGVPFAEQRHGERPSDVQVRIIEPDRDVLGGNVWTVDAVADIGDVCQHLEAVQHAWRHVQMTKVDVIEPEYLVSAERMRVRPGVDHHVVDGPASTANELCLAPPTAPVQAPQHAQPGPRLRVLHKGGRIDAVLGDNAGIESPGEHASVVPTRSRREQQDAGERRGFCSHGHIMDVPW